jgi:predicted DsbA family dithiol-disulfide isomerase
MAAFNDCFDSSKYRDRVDQDQLDGRAANIRATPSFVMTYTNSNGEVVSKVIEGAQPFEFFQQEIEAALADIGQ